LPQSKIVNNKKYDESLNIMFGNKNYRLPRADEKFDPAFVQVEGL